MRVLIVVLLVFITQAALPLGAVFFFSLLEDFNLNSRQSSLNFASLSADHLLYCNTFVDFLQYLNVFVKVNVSRPAVGNAEE